MAKDLKIANETLHQFVHCNGTLTPETLDELVADLFAGHLTYDPNLDRIRPISSPEPSTQHNPPPITELMTLPKFKGGPPPAQTGYPPPKPKAKRAGWVE